MKPVTIVILCVLVLLSGAAAYIGAGLLGGQSPLGVPNGPLLNIAQDGSPGVQMRLDIEPAKEIAGLGAPLFKAGIFVRRADNSIFVGTGAIKVLMSKDDSGKVSMSSDYDGPVVEVVLTHATIVYRDLTLKQFNGPPPAGQKLQQVLETGSLDEIGQNSTVQVWGTQTGNRATASVIVYTVPPVMQVR